MCSLPCEKIPGVKDGMIFKCEEPVGESYMKAMMCLER